MRLKPSFGSKLNDEGLSPIHVALQNHQHNLVHRLVEINKDLVGVKGKEGITPLHFVCQFDDRDESINVLGKLLEVCPDCIKDVNVRNETALHISLKNEKMRAFRTLFFWLTCNVHKDAYSIERSVLNWKDSDGNNILHIAALKNNKEAFDLLANVMNTNAKNLEKQTALDLAEAHLSLTRFGRTLLNVRAKVVSAIIKTTTFCFTDMYTVDRSVPHVFSLNDYISTQMTRIQVHVSEEQRNALMVVGTLIATAIYQTVLSPPGGLTQAQGGSDNGPNSNNLLNATAAAGKSVLPHKVFSVLKSLNSCVFVGAIGIIHTFMPFNPVSTLGNMLLVLFIASYFVSQSAISP